MMRSMKSLFFLAVPVLLVLTACAPQALVRDDPPIEAGAAELFRLIEAERYEPAMLALAELLERTPESRQRALLRLEVAESLLAAGQTAAARELLAPLHEADFDRRDQARLALARAELAVLEGDMSAAAWLLAQIRADVPIRLIPRLRALEQRLDQAQDRAAGAALSELEASLARGDFEPELALALLIEYPTSALEALIASHGGRAALAPWLDLALSARRYLLDDERLRPALGAWEQRHPTVGYSGAAAAEWVQAWRLVQPAPARVAVILPAPGSSLARPGRSLSDGLMATWSQLSREQRPQLEFFHSGDQAEQAIAAWSAARASGADFIIGPLGREQVDAVLALRDGGVPLLLLNHPTDPRLLADFPGSVKVLALTPEEEAEIAAARALVDGRRRALVLRQDSDWGDRVADAFAHTFTLGGGRVVRDMRYPAAQVDHTILLEVLLGLDRSRERASALQRTLGVPIQAEPARRSDADLIFLASRSDDARALRPQLKFFGAEDLPVMATSQVLAGAPDPRRDHDLEQVLLPIAPWFLDQGEAAQRRQQAERLFAGLDNPTLSRLFALGADAITLLPWLNSLSSDPMLQMAGLTGRLRVDENGRIERDLPFIRLADGRAQTE